LPPPPPTMQLRSQFLRNERSIAPRAKYRKNKTGLTDTATAKTIQYLN
jgi:hypothetical protein